MTDPVNLEIVDQIALISLVNPPVNALSQPVRAGIVAALEEATRQGARAVVLVGDGRCFSAGADIKEFGKPPLAPFLPDVLNTVEASEIPVVAALHGVTLGGGFELALAAHYRCAMPAARVGLPEVKLGLLPGAGGTQRTPRLAGHQAALDLMITGKPMAAGPAAQAGLIDRICEGDDLRTAALGYALELVEQGAGPRRVSEMPLDSKPDAFFEDYAASIARRIRGLEAPGRIIECVKAAQSAAANGDFAIGLERERELFMECLKSAQSAALRHVFAAERAANKIPDLDPATPSRAISHVGIIGAGTMGGGIAMCFANAGIRVTLLDVDEAGIERGMATIRRNYEVSQKKGRFSAQQVAETLDRIGTSTRYADLADADMVIEAVFEDLALKKKVFAELDAVCKPGAILATNTSYQDVNAIAAATARPADVVGTHFFSPANVMKLLEVVRADETAPDVLATVMQVARKIGKVAVVSGVCYGFIGNRMLGGYLREAQTMLLEGATPEFVDGAMEQFGMAMGPLAVCDLAGLDVGYRARASRMAELGIEDAPKWPGDELVERDRLGQKSGAGFYRYDRETRARISDPEVIEMIRGLASARGIEPRTIDGREVVERCVYALVSEGARILSEGIAARPGDIDIVYLYGYGFPAHRGGPMFYASQQGLDAVADAISRYRARYGEEAWPEIDLTVINAR